MIFEEYTGKFFSEFYDILHSNCNDSEVISRLLKPYGKRILELGCGTGRIAIPLAKFGYKVTGIENSIDMINYCNTKDYPNETFQIVHGDARNFYLDNKFDVILMCCNFINNFIDPYDIVKVLECCRKHLVETGVIIIDVSIPDICFADTKNIIEDYSCFNTDRGTKIYNNFIAKFDILNQVEYDSIYIEERDSENNVIRKDEAHDTLAWYMPREIRSIVREADMHVIKETGKMSDIDCKVPISLNGDSMLFYVGLN